MMRFEEYVVKTWGYWDDLGDGYQFGDCVLNPSFFIGAEDDLKQINELSEKHNVKPSVYFQFADSGFLVEISLWTDDEDGNYVEIRSWAYEGGIIRGNKIASQD